MSENNEPFMDAAKSDNIVLLQSLVDSGFDVNCRDEVSAQTFSAKPYTFNDHS